jgi:hypothetical protein
MQEGGEAAGGAGEFRMLTWNVQNLFAAGSEDGPPTQAALGVAPFQ